MVNYKELKKNGITVTGIQKISDNVDLITTRDNKYILKNKVKDLNKTFNYLSSRSFNNFPKYQNMNNYCIYNYIQDSNISKEERLYEMINLLIMLHLKTTRFKNIDIDDYKIIYEKLFNKIDYLSSYYMSLNDVIDSEIYMSPSQYLLARNISKIYSVLSFCRNELEDWYELIKNSTRQRIVLIHNNLDLSHIIYNKTPYFISWDKCKLDIPIFDLEKIYNKYYGITDFDILLNQYQKKYPLTKEELKLLFIMISIPNKIEFSKDEFKNIKIVKHTINKINKGDQLIKSYYSKEKVDIK